MIAYIDEPIEVEIDREFLEEYSVWHDGKYILPQKIQLNETDMNCLFSEVFMGMDIEYGWHGGCGCDFAITISKRG